MCWLIILVIKRKGNTGWCRDGDVVSEDLIFTEHRTDGVPCTSPISTHTHQPEVVRICTLTSPLWALDICRGQRALHEPHTHTNNNWVAQAPATTLVTYNVCIRPRLGPGWPACCESPFSLPPWTSYNRTPQQSEWVYLPSYGPLVALVPLFQLVINKGKP